MNGIGNVNLNSTPNGFKILIFHFSWKSYQFYDYFNLGGLFDQFFSHFSMIWQSLEIKKTKCMTLSLVIICFRSLYGKEHVKYAVIFCYKRKKSYCMIIHLLMIEVFPMWGKRNRHINYLLQYANYLISSKWQKSKPTVGP